MFSKLSHVYSNLIFVAILVHKMSIAGELQHFKKIDLKSNTFFQDFLPVEKASQNFSRILEIAFSQALRIRDKFVS
jgi:hypothetical protein